MTHNYQATYVRTLYNIIFRLIDITGSFITTYSCNSLDLSLQLSSIIIYIIYYVCVAIAPRNNHAQITWHGNNKSEASRIS